MFLLFWGGGAVGFAVDFMVDFVLVLAVATVVSALLILFLFGCCADGFDC